MKHEVVFEGEETVHYRKTVKMNDKELKNLKMLLERNKESEEDIESSYFFTSEDICDSSDIAYEDFYCYVDDEDIMMEDENV